MTTQTGEAADSQTLIRSARSSLEHVSYYRGLAQEETDPVGRALFERVARKYALKAERELAAAKGASPRRLASQAGAPTPAVREARSWAPRAETRAIRPMLQN